MYEEFKLVIGMERVIKGEGIQLSTSSIIFSSKEEFCDVAIGLQLNLSWENLYISNWQFYLKQAVNFGWWTNHPIAFLVSRWLGPHSFL